MPEPGASNGEAGVERIAAGSRVTLFFALALPEGEEIDSNFAGEPASFRLGDGSMLPGFEEELLGLAVGDEKEVLIPASRAFGEVNTANRQRLPRERFKHLFDDALVPTEVGTVLSFKDPAGFDLPGVVRAMDDSGIEVDFNHPLAGRDILFRVRIVAVLAPDLAPVEVKL